MKGPRHLTIVIKLGTSSIVDEKTHEPLLSILSLIVETAVKLHKDGHKVVIVSSGAIGVGLRRMNIDKRPKHLPRSQALAAVGQCRLMSLWDSLFNHLQQPVAQILLTRNDIADRTQYLNAQNTFAELLNMGVIPIVNENDTLAVAEIKFGDNDTLSAITAAMVQADYLFLMTDVDCLYDKNPRTNPDAHPIEVVEDIAVLAADVSTAGSSLGTGGMSTKIVAARLATSAGVTTIITRSSNPGNVYKIVESLEASKASAANSTSSTPPIPPPKPIPSSAPSIVDGPARPLQPPAPPSTPPHTRFLPGPHPIRDRYFWLLHGLAPHGTLYIDQGAHEALANKAGLLPVGVVGVEGNFSQQEAVRLVVVARGVSVFSSTTTLASTGTSASASTPITTSPSTSLCTSSSMPPPPPSSTPSSSTTAAATEAKPERKTERGGEEDRGEEIGRALVNYSAPEISRIMGLRSSEIRAVLGYADSEYIALRENISLLRRDGGGGTGSMQRASRPATPALTPAPALVAATAPSH